MTFDDEGGRGVLNGRFIDDVIYGRPLTTIDELLSKVSVLLELICMRDGSFHVAGNGAPLFSLQEVNLFISSICTCDV